MPARKDQLGRAAADVDDHRPGVERSAGGDPAVGELCLLVAREEARGEPVAPLDLAEERHAVVGVSHGAGRDRERALHAELLELAAVIGEDIPDTCDRNREQLAPRVDRLAEAGDPQPALELAHGAVLHVCDEQSGGVGAEVDRADAHVTSWGRTRGPTAAFRAPRSWRRPARALARSRARAWPAPPVARPASGSRGPPWPPTSSPRAASSSAPAAATRASETKARQARQARMTTNGVPTRIAASRKPSAAQKSTSTVVYCRSRRGVEQSGSSPGS